MAHNKRYLWLILSTLCVGIEYVHYRPLFYLFLLYFDWHKFDWLVSISISASAYLSYTLVLHTCYKMIPKKKTISYAFINLMGNIQEYNVGKI